MALSLENSKLTYGLSASAAATSINTSGDFTLGIDPTIQLLTNATNGFSFGGCIYGSGNSVTLTVSSGSASGTSFVTGVAQVETATASGTTSQAGNVSVTFTAAAVTGSPVTVSVAVANADDAATWAGKVRTALALNTAISSAYTISGSGTSIIATRIPLVVRSDCPSSNYANDSTLNIALANGSPSPGITPASTSANTTAGVATSGVYLLKGDGKDMEGNTLATLTGIKGFLISCDSGGLVASTTDFKTTLPSGDVTVVGGLASVAALLATMTIASSSANTSFSATFLGQ